MDDLRTLWATHAELLEKRLRLDQRVLRATLVDKTETTMSRYAVFAWIQLGLAGLLAIANGGFLAANLGETGYLLSAIAVQLYLILHLGSAVYRLVLVQGIDWAAPVTSLQRAIERVKIAEVRSFKWALLLGVLLWVQALAVLVKGVLGVDLYAHVSGAWVIANTIFGLVVVFAGQALARRLVERSDLGPRARSLIDHLSGYRLRRATRFLDELAAFERGEG